MKTTTEERTSNPGKTSDDYLITNKSNETRDLRNNPNKIQKLYKKHKVTPFQQRVYNALLLIPTGKLTTYKHLASFLNCNSAQAVGQALKRNPLAPTIPCHRVVKSDLSIGGFFGQTSGGKIVDKKKLLEQEGISFDEDNHLKSDASEVLFDFSSSSDESISE